MYKFTYCHQNRTYNSVEIFTQRYEEILLSRLHVGYKVDIIFTINYTDTKLRDHSPGGDHSCLPLSCNCSAVQSLSTRRIPIQIADSPWQNYYPVNSDGQKLTKKLPTKSLTKIFYL